jgi:hypothetical protein
MRQQISWIHPVKIVASMAALHGCGSLFIHRSSSNRVAGTGCDVSHIGM